MINNFATIHELCIILQNPKIIQLIFKCRFKILLQNPAKAFFSNLSIIEPVSSIPPF